jgi:glycosyltransferase involved in cell wall biosynthesis
MGGIVRTALIVPALDEAEVIGGLVARVPRDVVDEVIVVDNGSSDTTAREAAQAGARVVGEPRRGYGSACWAGVCALAAGTEIVAFMDGDGSQRPEEIAWVLGPIVNEQADFVLGARVFAGQHPPHATLGTRLVAAFVAWRFGIRLHDVGPLRAIRVSLLGRLGMRDRAFGWPVEMVVKAAAQRARILEVPVTHQPRLGGRSKVAGTLGGSVRAGWAFMTVALRATREVS